MKYLMILSSLLALCACSVDSPPAAAPAPTTAQPAAKDDYVGKGTVYDTQFKALHDAKQLGAKMNEDAARLDEQIDPENNPPRD